MFTKYVAFLRKLKCNIFIATEALGLSAGAFHSCQSITSLGLLGEHHAFGTYLNLLTLRRVLWCSYVRGGRVVTFFDFVMISQCLQRSNVILCEVVVTLVLCRRTRSFLDSSIVSHIFFWTCSDILELCRKSQCVCQRSIKSIALSQKKYRPNVSQL